MKKAALVLSGGALRGYAQIGAVRVIEKFLQKKNVKITTVVGTSFGAITASLTALDYSAEEMTAFSKDIGFKLFHIHDLKLLGPALIRGRRIKGHLLNCLGNKTFNDVSCELIINTVDILTGTEYKFTKAGLSSADDSRIFKDNSIKLIDAVLASIAVPFIFRPKEMFNMLLVDGGLVNPLGVRLINPKQYDYVICVDVSLPNFDFITLKKATKRLMIQQAISILQRQFYLKKKTEYQKEKNVIMITPNVGIVNPIRRNELDRIIQCGIDEAKKVLTM
jgi:NTE family protein